MDREVWRAAIYGVTKSRTQLSDWTELNWFIIGDWNAKIGSQEIPGVTGKFDIAVQKEAEQKLTKSCQENALVIANTLFQQHKRQFTYGHHQMVNTEIELITFFVAKDGEAVYSQQKQDLVTQTSAPYGKSHT